MILRVCVATLLLLAGGSYGLESYSKVSTFGSAAGSGPKVFKAMNMDLIYPRSFNWSENVISTTEGQPLADTVDHLTPATDKQLTPEENVSSEQLSSQPSTSEEPTPAANNYPPTFVFPSNHANEFRDSPTTLPPTATGRAVDYHPTYPFSQLLTQNNKAYKPPSMASRPVPRPNAAQRFGYPSSYQAPRKPSRAEIDKLTGKGQFSDRFTPGEATASSVFKLNQIRNRKPSLSRPIGQPSNKISSYVPAKNLYAFPPNVDAKYPSPSESKQAAPSDTVSSYLPPPAGPLDNGKLVGPVNPDLLPDNMIGVGGEGKDSPGDGYFYNPPPNPVDLGGNGGYLYEPPKTPFDAGPTPPVMGMMDTLPPPPTMNRGMMSMMGAPPPAPSPMNNGMMSMMGRPPPAPPAMNRAMMGAPLPAPPPMNMMSMMGPPQPAPPMGSGMMSGGMMDDSAPPADHDHHHHDNYDYPHDVMGYEEDKEYPTPPPGYMEEHDDHFHGHHDYHDYPDHHHHHDVIYDDYHDHHHDEHDHPTEPPPPPPPPAPEPPEKKFSYFYIGRKLYYIPLYATMYFICHVLWMLLKSINRHKVYLTNHYVSRSGNSDLSNQVTSEAIDKLTLKVMDGIAKFKLKYFG